MVTDPVCGMQVNKAFAPAQMSYQGQTYYFCIPECQARFAEKYSERPEEGAKQVCQAFANWSHEKSRLARIVVKYAL